tara:strand:- start:760 stop:1491 length:732 start_codon:yes stop_codon:yes gene_type:complete
MKILVLGHNGMLGHMVYKYLSTKDCEIVTTDLRWPTDELRNFVVDFDGDFVVNCIGAIHQRTSEFGVNTDLPIWLDMLQKDFKIIHPGTDCEIDDDDYGNSKREATEYLLKQDKDTIIIKTSIIGPELNTKASLLEWFLSIEEDSISGYSKCYWNGNTTLQWAKICYKIMCNYDKYDILNIPTSDCISKYKLLNIMKEVFETNIKIKENSDVTIEKCLLKTDNMSNIDIKTQLEELKEFYYDN